MNIIEKPLHIETKSKNDIAPIVLMPGDPLRAKYIADNFLTDAKCVTSVRNMLGFTGYFKNERVTVMASGMGMPSLSIYVLELIHYYDVKKIIRIGTCGVVDKDINVPEIILASRVYSETNWDFSYDSNHRGIVYPSNFLNNKIIDTANELNIRLHVGDIITNDNFGPYTDFDKVLERVPNDLHLLAEEMESYALTILGNDLKIETATILTAVDNKYSNKVLSPDERQSSLDEMIRLALNSLIK